MIDGLLERKRGEREVLRRDIGRLVDQRLVLKRVVKIFDDTDKAAEIAADAALNAAAGGGVALP